MTRTGETSRRHKMTVRWLAALKPPPKPQQIDWHDADRDGAGLVLRVSYGGSKVWYALYRRGKAVRRIKIGAFPTWGLKDARIEAGKVRRAAKDGGDPAAERQAQKSAATVKEFCRRYIEEYAKPKKRSWKKDEARLNLYVVPKWGPRRPPEITRGDVRALVKGIALRGHKGKPAPIAANRLLEVLRRFFGWLIEEEICPGLVANPATGVLRPGSEAERTRSLTPDELAAFWTALAADEDQSSADVMRLMLLLDQRRNEITKTKRAYVDTREHWLNLPVEATKTKFPYRIPLSPPAVAIVARALARSTDPEYLFPKRQGGGPVSETKVRLCFDRVIAAAKIENFRPHDLLHTATSGMTALGFARTIVAKVRHHTEPGQTTGRYDHHSYDKEKRQAVEAWGRRVLEIISGTAAPVNVVQFRG